MRDLTGSFPQNESFEEIRAFEREDKLELDLDEMHLLLDQMTYPGTFSSNSSPGLRVQNTRGENNYREMIEEPDSPFVFKDIFALDESDRQNESVTLMEVQPVNNQSATALDADCCGGCGRDSEHNN